ncbi:hypothetical protein ACFLWS_07145 [Chloroflexota bacterium]
MKTKHACGLLVLSVLCFLLAPSPAQAEMDALKWVKTNKPGLEGNLIISPSEVSEIAVGSRGTIYALDSSENSSRVYQSLDAGATWKDITSRLIEAGAVLPASKVAIAPDKSGIVAVVTNSGAQVYLSSDGGSTWTGTNVPSLAGTIQAITISRQYVETEESLREIAIGTADWGDNTTTGQVWVFKIGKQMLSWQSQSLVVDPGHVGGEVSAIAYSPNYQRDYTIIAVASTTADVAGDYQNKTWLCLGERDTAAGTTSWNTYSGYPVAIATAGDGIGVSFSSSLALPSNYSGSQELSQRRQLFLSYNRDPDANDDVYWINDMTSTRLDVNAGANIDISSIAYYGTTTSGKLLVGDVGPVAGSTTVQVRRSSNPFASSPTWNLSTVPPTGPGNATVSWSSDGEAAYCGTSQSPGAAWDESAFSTSSDDGDNWQQLGLVDTNIKLSDVAPTPNSDTLFTVTYSDFGPEGIWRSARTRSGLGWYWSRQLSLDTTSNRIILRLSPNYTSDYTIYTAEVGGTLMAVSHNRGNSWQWYRAMDAVVDMVVVDEETLYVALPGGFIRKSTNGAFSWGGAVETGLSRVNMLSAVDKETILVGGQNGDIAYSTDSGKSFTRIREVIGNGSDDVQVVADANFHENQTIYAATDTLDEGIWRWVIGLSTGWEQIDEPITQLGNGQRIGGLAMSPEGILYALRLEQASAISGGMTRSLNPAEQYSTEVEFDLINRMLPDGATLDYLKLSGDPGQNDLWAIDTTTTDEIIYRFQDTMRRPVELLKPVDKATGEGIRLNTTDLTMHVTLSWEPVDGATSYRWELYDDAAGESVAFSGDTTGTQSDIPDLLPGKTYYWRVRVIEPVESPWSEMWSFASAPVSDWSPLTPLSPVLGAGNVALRPAFTWDTAHGATGYEFVLARDSEFSDVIIAMTGENALPITVWVCDRDLDYSTTYFWKVRAISATSHSGWVTSVFTTVSKPVAEPPPVVVEQALSPVPPPTEPSPEPTPKSPSYMLWWAAISVGTTLFIALLVLIVRTAR